MPKPSPMKPQLKDKQVKNKSKTKSKVAKGFKPKKPMNPTAIPPMLGF